MTPRIIAAAVLALVCAGYPAAVAGQGEQDPEYDPYWLKVENPDTLFVDYNQYGECPFGTESIEKTLDNLLVRSRLKRASLSHWLFNSTKFKLRIRVNCDDDDGRLSRLFNVSTSFREGITVQRPIGPVKIDVDHVPDYDRLGVYTPDREQNTDFLKNAIRDSVEDALTDYLKANFDL